jgi:hypothetical protein
MNQGRGNGGLRGLPAPEVPPHWLPYFAVPDMDDGIGKLEELGGENIMGPIDIGIAKVGIVKDPQGAPFALYAGQLED